MFAVWVLGLPLGTKLLAQFWRIEDAKRCAFAEYERIRSEPNAVVIVVGDNNVYASFSVVCRWDQ